MTLDPQGKAHKKGPPNQREEQVQDLHLPLLSRVGLGKSQGKEGHTIRGKEGLDKQSAGLNLA